MQGIVFNPHYMAYVDVALTEYWRALGLAYSEAFAAEGVDTFMVAASQVYRDAARFDDELDVSLRTEYLGTTSFRMGFVVCRAGAGLVSGQATYVVGDRITRAPRALPRAMVDRIEAFETVPPERKPHAAPAGGPGGPARG